VLTSVYKVVKSLKEIVVRIGGTCSLASIAWQLYSGGSESIHDQGRLASPGQAS